MIAQPSNILGLDREIPPEPVGKVTYGAENVNHRIDRTNLRPGLLDKIDNPIHIFSVSAAALLLFLFLWFLLKSL